MSSLLFRLLVSASASALLLAGCALPPPRPAAAEPAPVTLREAFRGIFHLGVAVSQSQFSGRNVADAAVIVREFDALSPENVLKWESVHPGVTRYNFAPADQYVEFGTTHGMFIVGHNLVWHSQTPAWVFQNADGTAISREALLARMRDHIMAVVGRYRGRIAGWDVVNEAIADYGGYRQSPWFRIIGQDYLLKAYQFAHEADPAAELYYNDYSLEVPAKRATAVELVKYLQAGGVHLTGVGLQGHYKLDANTPSVRAIEDTITTFAGLGLKVMITELDIDVLPGRPGADLNARQSGVGADPYRAGLPADVQQALAKRYADVFAVYLRHRESITRVTFWGLNDAQSWLKDFPFANRVNHPLLFDRQNQPKPAFAAVLAAPRLAGVSARPAP